MWHPIPPAAKTRGARGEDDEQAAPAEVLGFASGVRHREEDLSRAFFSTRFVRVLDALWLAAQSLTVEHAGEPLSRYAVKVEAFTGELRSVARPRLFETSHGLRQPQHRLFALDSLGECGWLKALRLEGYAPRRPWEPLALRQALFPYAEAL